MLRMAAATQPKRSCHSSQITLNERDAGALHGDMDSCAHGNPNISVGKSRSIIHAITGHADDLASGLQLNCLGFLLRQHLCFYAVYAAWLGNGKSSRAAVACERGNLRFLLVQQAHRFWRARLDGIGDTDEARCFPIHGDENNRLAFRSKLVRLGGQIGRGRGRGF